MHKSSQKDSYTCVAQTGTSRVQINASHIQEQVSLIKELALLVEWFIPAFSKVTGASIFFICLTSNGVIKHLINQTKFRNVYATAQKLIKSFKVSRIIQFSRLI